MDKYIPHIGKNVIETLTLGMYEDARFIYREYIQNAADQIDVAVEEKILTKKNEGEINVLIDINEKKIKVEDNATGIREKDVLQFLGDIANSQKDRTKRKGFRGIGRLGGLGYCEKLIFETSYKGENIKSIITLNAKQLKKFIEDDSVVMDAAEVISFITNLDKDYEAKGAHYFKVELQGVTNEKLLDVNDVRKYLSIVAPIPFSEDFTFADKIHQCFDERGIKIEEYDVHLNINDEPLFKPYKSIVHSKTGQKIVKIIDIDFFELRNNDNLLIAFGWYGVSGLLNNIIHQDDYERGIRIRKNNIQIGDENTLNRFFKEERFNHHFIGEIHVIGNSFEIDDEFKPNARRDYFNDTKIVQIFEQKLKLEFEKLYKYAHTSSEIHSGIKKVEKFKQAKEKFKTQKFRSKNEETKRKKELDKLKEDAKKGEKTLKKVESKSNSNKVIKTILNHKIEDKDLVIHDEDKSLIVKQYNEPDLAKLDKKERNLVYEIFKLIEENLNVDDAERIKQIIAKHYN